ncbi:Integrating conjugative element protein [Pseudomonas sp. 8Z]|uniref:TIGR03756 family integrating conjugative element protein n=1 Tax=Pseudomonas sp. 8Z TaxID=2653166 RepID=UPI0012F1CEB1|nr:TIGR03756 family integrating conjugative element protein [Pseudomonas sp. 8Z]VXC22660.1 Integrating conjugative element protein [Pseudomonas sp. 8Z]
MNRRPPLRRLSMALMFGTAVSASAAINTAAIVSSTVSADCLEYRVVGICFWLRCTSFGCDIETSTKVRHYVPDAVVSSYANTGMNPWTDVADYGSPTVTAQAGNDGTTNHVAENNMTKFKEADVIGHPGGAAFSKFASSSGYICNGATTAYVPYLLSTLDTIAWRYGIPESVYPEALTPGKREVGSFGDQWGNIYPRSGFLDQADDYKMAAVVAQRAGDITTRDGQVHVYWPMLADEDDGYWPAGELLEGDASTGKWQELTPTLSQTCAVFPNTNQLTQAIDGGYAWALWRPYSCCERKGQTFLGSVDFQ